MGTLTTQAAVEAVLGSTIDAGDVTRLTELIAQASALIEDEVGRSFDTDPITAEFHTTPARARALLLDHWPIASVEEIRENGTALTVEDDYVIDLDAGIIRRASSGSPAYWYYGLLDAIEVDYTPAVPAALNALAAQMVARAFRGGDNEAAVPTVMAGLRQLTIGRWSATREGSSETRAGTAIYLTDAELRIAHRWRDRRP